MTIQGTVSEIAVDLLCADRRRLPVLVNSTLREAFGDRPAEIRTAVFQATGRREYERELLRARQRAQESQHRVHLLAQTLQQTLIPPALPDIPGLDVAAAYRPAGHGDEVGGDFYDLFETSPGEWGLVLGDVCGKGVAAAVVTSLARHTIRSAVTRVKQPSAVLRRLNTALIREEGERFCTAVYARIRPDPEGAFRLTVALGGHPFPLRVTGAGAVSPLGRAGDLVGVFPEARTSDTSVGLAPGEAAVFFTDGVTEARRDREHFEDGRLDELLTATAGLPAREVADRIAAEVLAFQTGLPHDDLALVVLKVPV
jgi:sigma-B regulation protein RsbU (phosphoserine phosphatase)